MLEQIKDSAMPDSLSGAYAIKMLVSYPRVWSKFPAKQQRPTKAGWLESSRLET